MAIDKGNSSAMYNLGLYYSQQEDYNNMKKYYTTPKENSFNKSIHCTTFNSA
jgi:arylamine N-acetyltransferase